MNPFEANNEYVKPAKQVEREERRERDIAESFRPDPQMEQLIKLRQNDPAAFDSIAAGSIRMSLAHYESAKDSAEQYAR